MKITKVQLNKDAENDMIQKITRLKIRKSKMLYFQFFTGVRIPQTTTFFVGEKRLLLLVTIYQQKNTSFSYNLICYKLRYNMLM